ncbi:SCO1664 family protein [Streptomyces sp. 4N509B]|uniref:SCO1664 family protein n=1 Tax=Streptomyces sp. 4N509B TaxID=3457413 RepID=UPI003FD598FD
MTPVDRAPDAADRVTEVLARGELVVHGRLADASNAVLYATATLGDRRVRCVYKPVAGERPLWDFPDGTLARREVAAYEVCRALGWQLVPPTVLRDGPYGEGMCQLWIGPGPHVPDTDPDTDASDTDASNADTSAADGRETRDVRDTDEEPGGPETEGPETDEDGHGVGELLALVDAESPEPGWRAVVRAQVDDGRTALLVHADDERLRRLAALDAVINNADRKGGHLLPLPDGRLYGIDHGVTFHTEDKLRTLLWGWAGEPMPEPVLAALRGLLAELADGRPLLVRLRELLSEGECQALRARTATLLRTGRYPRPGGEWPAIPWPIL